MPKNTTWETQEVVNWLINHEASYNELQRRVLRHYDAEDLTDPDLLEDAADKVKHWVKGEHAPRGLYESFLRPPASSFDDVDWAEVVKSILD